MRDNIPAIYVNGISRIYGLGLRASQPHRVMMQNAFMMFYYFYRLKAILGTSALSVGVRSVQCLIHILPASFAVSDEAVCDLHKIAQDRKAFYYPSYSKSETHTVRQKQARARRHAHPHVHTHTRTRTHVHVHAHAHAHERIYAHYLRLFDLQPFIDGVMQERVLIFLLHEEASLMSDVSEESFDVDGRRLQRHVNHAVDHDECPRSTNSRRTVHHHWTWDLITNWNEVVCCLLVTSLPRIQLAKALLAFGLVQAPLTVANSCPAVVARLRSKSC